MDVGIIADLFGLPRHKKPQQIMIAFEFLFNDLHQTIQTFMIINYWSNYGYKFNRNNSKNK